MSFLATGFQGNRGLPACRLLKGIVLLKQAVGNACRRRMWQAAPSRTVAFLGVAHVEKAMEGFSTDS